MYEDYYDYGLYVEEYSIEDVREDLRRVVDYFKSKEYHEHAMDLFMVKYRGFPIEVAEQAECFCIDEEIPISDLPDWMLHSSLGIVKNNYVPMWGRCVFPVKDVSGNVMGFVGWDPFVDPKYLDSKNYGYKAKNASFYGMEMMPEYYNSKKPMFVTEGLMCTLYLRWKGFNAISSLGSWLTPYQIQILKRFGDRCIVISDNDITGDKYIKQIHRELPKARCYQTAYGKDIDGCRKYEEGIYESQLLKELSIVNNPFAKTSILIRR